MEWRGVPQPPMQIGQWTRSSKGGYTPWKRLEEGFQTVPEIVGSSQSTPEINVRGLTNSTSDSDFSPFAVPPPPKITFTPVEQEKTPSYTAQLRISLQNTVIKKMELFYNRYRYEKDTVGASEIPTDVLYMPFYSEDIRGVFGGLATVFEGVKSARFDAPIDGQDGSVEGMRKLKELFELYEKYLNALEKDRELAKTKKDAEDIRLHFWAYYKYTMDKLESVGATKNDIGMIVPSDGETGNETKQDQQKIISSTNIDDVSDIKTKYERLLYNDVVSVQGASQKNDILAKLKEMAKNSLNDFVYKFEEKYKDISLGTKYTTMNSTVSNAYTNRNGGIRTIDKYSRLQIIKDPYIPTSSEPKGINLIMIDSIVNVYKDYTEFNKTVDGLKDKAMKYIDFDELRPKVRVMIVAYNTQYNENPDARNFKIPDVSGISFDGINLSQIDLHSPSTSSFTDGSSGSLSDIAYINDSIEKTENRLDQLEYLQKKYIDNGHFNRLYIFLKDQTFMIMKTAKRIYDKFKSNKDILNRLDRTTLDVCENLDGLSTDLSTSRFPDAAVINLLNPADYTSYNSEIPKIILKYIKAITAMTTTNRDVGEIIKGTNLAFEFIYQQLKETQVFFMNTQRLINTSGLSLNNVYRYPIDNFIVNDRKTADSISTNDSIYKVYLLAFKEIYDKLLKPDGVVASAIEMFVGTFKDNSSLIDAAKEGSFIGKDKHTEFQTMNTNASTEISNLKNLQFYKDVIAPNVENIKKYKNDDPEFKNILNLNTSILNTYNKYDSSYEYLIRTLGLIPLNRNFLLNSLDKLDDTINLSLTIPNSNIKMFTDLLYALIGGGGSGGWPGMARWCSGDCVSWRRGGGGATGQLKSTSNVIGNKPSPVIPLADIGTNNIIVKIGKGATYKGFRLHDNINAVDAINGGTGEPTTISKGSTVAETALGGLGGNAVYNYFGGNHDKSINDSIPGHNGGGGGAYNPIISGGAFNDIFNITSPMGAFAYDDSGVDPEDGKPFTGSGGGSGACFYEGLAGAKNMFVQSGAGGSGYAELIFTRNQPSNIPISRFYNFVNNASDNWNGPYYNKKCDGSYETNIKGFTRFDDAVKNGSGNRIIFSPVTLQFYRLNASEVSAPKDVEDINDVGYTYWDFSLGSLSGRKFGVVESRMTTEGFTNPPRQEPRGLQKDQQRGQHPRSVMPQRPPSNPTVYRFGTSLDDAFRGSLLT